MSQSSATTLPHLEDALGGLEDRLDQAVADVAARMGALRAALAERGRRADAAERQAAELEQQLAIAEAKLAVETMHAAGLAAQASQLMAMALDAGVPALAEMMARQAAGDTASNPLAEVYDAAFDAKAAELGIDDPTRFRAA